MNRVILIGNLGKDPEIRHFEGGSCVVKFTLATHEPGMRNGERIKITEWHDIELWDKLAEVADKYLKKGSKVMIEGKIKTDTWKDQAGQDRQKKVIRGVNMELLDRFETTQNTDTKEEDHPSPIITPPSSFTSGDVVSTGSEPDDLPF